MWKKYEAECRQENCKKKKKKKKIITVRLKQVLKRGGGRQDCYLERGARKGLTYTERALGTRKVHIILDSSNTFLSCFKCKNKKIVKRVAVLREADPLEQIREAKIKRQRFHNYLSRNILRFKWRSVLSRIHFVKLLPNVSYQRMDIINKERVL
jgi:hypothetical protein